MKKIKLAVLALLGFSTACSTVKNTTESSQQVPAEESQPQPEATESEAVEELKIERIKLMYGTPTPRPTETPEQK